MTVLFFGILGSVSFLTAWMACWIYRRLPDHWLCEYGEMPSEIHRAEHRCTHSKRVLVVLTAVVWMELLAVLNRRGGVPGRRYEGWSDQLGLLDGIFSAGYGQMTGSFLSLLSALLYVLLLSLILFPSVLSDLDYLIIPDQTCAAAAAAAFFRGVSIGGVSGVTDVIAGGLACGVLAWFSAAIPSFFTGNESMGMGDLKLLSACGAAAAASAEEGTGFLAGVSVFSGAVLMSAVWFSLLLVFKKASYGEARPMAPWIAGSTLLCIAWF